MLNTKYQQGVLATGKANKDWNFVRDGTGPDSFDMFGVKKVKTGLGGQYSLLVLFF